jgi:hypothetical protein
LNPAYRHARFRAELPHGGLPESLCIVTACNPDGRTIAAAENEGRTAAFRKQLAKLGLDHFPVTGFDAHSTHEEAGFGIVCELEAAYAMGNAFLQEAIFHIHRGKVSLVACGKTMTQEPLQDWVAMAEPPSHHPHFHFRGPFKLLKNPSTAFLCSTQCPGDKILEAYDWARRQCDTGGTVISGFHTPVEKDVLAILARRGANIIWVPGRDLPQNVDAVLKTPMKEGRLLIISPFPYGQPSRPSKASCSERNRFVLARATRRFIPHVSSGSSLAGDLGF